MKKGIVSILLLASLFLYGSCQGDGYFSSSLTRTYYSSSKTSTYIYHSSSKTSSSVTSHISSSNHVSSSTVHSSVSSSSVKSSSASSSSSSSSPSSSVVNDDNFTTIYKYVIKYGRIKNSFHTVSASTYTSIYCSDDPDEINAKYDYSSYSNGVKCESTFNICFGHPSNGGFSITGNSFYYYCDGLVSFAGQLSSLIISKHQISDVSVTVKYIEYPNLQSQYVNVMCKVIRNTFYDVSAYLSANGLPYLY